MLKAYFITACIVMFSSSSLAFSISDNGESEVDERRYLEEIDGFEAIKWVNEHNALSLKRLQSDPRYNELKDLYLKAIGNPNKLDVPGFTNERGVLSDFRTDDVNLRGLWRRTTISEYLLKKPNWQILLNVDALAKKEDHNWVFHGAQCSPVNKDRCLVSLSDGGKDAVTIREFDLATKTFVKGGFELPEAKQWVSWVDKDTVHVSREWDKGDLTASGYAYITKALKRGQPLSAAKEVFRGDKADISASASILYDKNEPVMQINSRRLAGEETITEYQIDDHKVRFPLPLTSKQMGYLDGQIIYRLREDWKSASGELYPTETIISFDVKKNMERPDAVEPHVVFTPGPQQVVSDVHTTKGHIIMDVLTNVMSELYSLSFKDGGWQVKKFDLPKNSSISVMSADQKTDDLFVIVTSFLEPTSLYWVNAGSLDTKLLQSDVSYFDSKSMQVTQNWVTSKDGTRVPYFLVSKKGIPLDGNNPTWMHAYGGFEVSMTPSYLGIFGATWLEKGGVYVLANIRGGGEFGSKWHQAGIKTKRQNVYDDFQAVAEDLIARKITSPRRLGISGGSNGGLLMGVQLVQRPDLWNAVAIEVPLLDMMRYTKLSAGASWIGEYGDPEDPVEGAFLRPTSPYHNLKEGVKYPEPFFRTSRYDDRVHPGHARKMAAKMEAMGLPFLFYENDDGGHSGATTSFDKPMPSVLEAVYFAQKLMD